MRKLRGLTQSDLAERADIADKYLSRIELGAVTPSVFVAAKLARGLATDVGAFAGGEMDPRRAVAIALLNDLTASDLDRAVKLLRALVE